MKIAARRYQLLVSDFERPKHRHRIDECEVEIGGDFSSKAEARKAAKRRWRQAFEFYGVTPMQVRIEVYDMKDKLFVGGA